MFEKIKRKIKNKAISNIQEAVYGRVLKTNEIENGHDDISYISQLSPLSNYIRHHYIYKEDGHFHRHYQEWRYKRIRKVLDLFPPEYFPGKRILELGGGTGCIGAFFADLGAEVFSIEGRSANRNFATIKYRKIKTFQSILYDLETEFTHFGRFDLILNFGFLEVVSNVDFVMQSCAKMSDHILLETLVCDSIDPEKVIEVWIGNEGIDHSINTEMSSRHSPSYIENTMQNLGYEFDRHFTPDLNTKHHSYDWEHLNNERVVFANGRDLRRFWYFHK